jgi:hypothetical protein
MLRVHVDKAADADLSTTLDELVAKGVSAFKYSRSSTGWCVCQVIQHPNVQVIPHR